MKNITKEMITKCSHTFTNGVTVVNCTPHPITFVDGKEAVSIQTSVLAGEKTGALVLTASAVEEPVGEFVVTTHFMGNENGHRIINTIRAELGYEKIFIVGSVIAAQSYLGEVVAMCPERGYEHCPPPEKRMSCERFAVYNS